MQTLKYSILQHISCHNGHSVVTGIVNLKALTIGQGHFLSACVNMQVDLNRCWVHMSKDTFTCVIVYHA